MGTVQPLFFRTLEASFSIHAILTHIPLSPTLLLGLDPVHRGTIITPLPGAMVLGALFTLLHLVLTLTLKLEIVNPPYR